LIVDAHTHLNNYHENRVRSIDDCLERLCASMERNHVDHALVLTSYKVTEHRPPTRDVVRAAEKVKQISVVAGISYLHYKERDLRELSDFLASGVLKGLKLYPGYEPFYPHDKRCQVIYDLAMEYDVPVMIHSGDTYTPTGKVRFAHPLHVDDVAVDNPGLKVVVCHLGNPWIRDCMEVVYKNKDVHADISGLVLGDFSERFEQFMLEQVHDMLIYSQPSTILYGTDWPIARMRSYLKFVLDLGLPDEALELLMWKNAATLFRLDLPPVKTSARQQIELALANEDDVPVA
jgi:predicted TIM-barrel fold metal-dependent hydrolase